MAYLLHQLLAESASKYPDHEAIAFRDQTMTYAELEVETNKLAHTLQGFGLERGERVGIHMNRSIDAVVGLFGVLKAGATYVPIDPTCPPGRLSYIINKCGMRFLLVSKERLTNIERAFPEDCPLHSVIAMNGLDSSSASFGSNRLVDWQAIREAASEDTPCVNTIDSDLAYILFTSGSTGIPKGVMISHLNSLTFVNSAHDFFRITMNDRFSNNCPLHFDMSVFDLFVAFKGGATIVVVPESTSTFPSQLAEFIEKNRISVWNSVPSALSLLANFTNLNNYNFSDLRLVLFAGEVFPIKHLRRLQQSVPRGKFYNIYGQTEANSSTYYWVEQTPSDDSAVLPIGRALPNFEVFALDEDGKKVNTPGERGELYVRASSVALGYWGDAERTGERFVKNPFKPDLNERIYKTGDMVTLDADGNYIFLGRKDHMIKSRGYRIEIGEIEAVLCNHEGIRNAVIIPIPDELIGNRIAAIVVPVREGAIRKGDVVKYCATRLAKYMIPEIIEFRNSLPMTSSGKVDRKGLGEILGKTHTRAGKEDRKEALNTHGSV
jgi:amino acid adenylation domain-containing protein